VTFPIRPMTRPQNWPFLYSIDGAGVLVGNNQVPEVPRVVLVTGVLDEPAATWPFAEPKPAPVSVDLSKYPDALF